MKPVIPVTDTRFVYLPAASHSDAAAFRERQQARMRLVQTVVSEQEKPSASVTKLNKRRREPPIAGEAT